MAVAISSGPPAYGAETSATALLQFTFRDSVRGTVIRPDAVLVDNQMIYQAIDEAGRLIIPVSPGDHRVLVKANGYNDMDSRQTALSDSTISNIMMLDPSETPEQLKTENLNRDIPADGTLLVGFVIDETSGRPVPGAAIELLNHDIKTATDKDGFFRLPVSMPDGQPMPDDPRGVIFGQRDFRITKDGYGFEERLNVLLESGMPKIFQISLVRGGGGNSVDEDAGRNNLQSGLFGRFNVEPESPPHPASMPEGASLPKSDEQCSNPDCSHENHSH